MATFTDADGDEWRIAVDAPTIMRVREDADPRFLLNDTEKDNTYDRLEGDPVLLCRVLFVLCAKQREERGVSAEDFYLKVIGDTIDGATDALLKAITSFTPRRTREVLEASAALRGRIRDHGNKRLLDRLTDPATEEQVLAVLDAAIDGAVAKMLSMPPESVTDTPASSGSIPPA